MPNDPKDRNKDAAAGKEPRKGQPGGGSQPNAGAARPDTHGNTGKPQTGPKSARGSSDDDQDADEATAPGKPKEFDESVRRKRGQEQADRDTDASTGDDRA